MERGFSNQERPVEEVLADHRLVARWIEPNPFRPELGDVRIKGSPYTVWGLAAAVDGANGDIRDVARGRSIHQNAVRAVQAFRRLHPGVIEDRLAQNLL